MKVGVISCLDPSSSSSFQMNGVLLTAQFGPCDWSNDGTHISPTEVTGIGSPSTRSSRSLG